MSSDAPLPVVEIRRVRIVMPDGFAFVQPAAVDLYEIRVPIFDPVRGPGVIALGRHEAAGMVWYEATRWA